MPHPDTRSFLRLRRCPHRLPATVWLAFALTWCVTGARDTSAEEPPGTIDAAAGIVEAEASPTAAYFEQARRRDGQVSAAVLGRRILRDHPTDAAVLDALAWGILTDTTLRHRDLPLALQAARAASTATGGKDPEILETHARALFMLGQRDEAITMQRRAVDLATEEPSARLFAEELWRSYVDPPPDPGPTDEDRIRTIEDVALGLVDSGKAVPVTDLLDHATTEPCGVDVVPPAVEPLSAEALFEKILPSVVIMAAFEPDPETGELEISLAAGFVVHASGIVVTNFHVIDVPESPILVAMTADGVVHPVSRVLAVSPRADIAVCRLEGTHDLPALPFTASARPGTRLHALSHPDASFWSFTDGILSRFFTLREDGVAKTMFATTADFAVGSSGGPLVDDRGNVVGMVSSTMAIYATGGEARRGACRRRPGARIGCRVDALPPDADDDQPAGDFQMGLNMCVPAADILRLLGARP